MAASKSLKSSDRQSIIKKLTTELKKRYKGGLPKTNLSVIETLIYATLLEDSTHEDAEAAFQRLFDHFFDLNEIRVSSVDEIKQVLGDLRDADWKAFRLREALQDIFEKHFAFDMEGLKRKTLDAAQKELGAIPHQTDFAQSYTLQTCCTSHVVPVDESMLLALRWLALTDAESTGQQAADEVKSATKKSDAPQFCYLLKYLSIDEKLSPAFVQDIEDTVTGHDASKRLAGLIKNGPPKPPKAKPAKKAAETKAAPAKKGTTKKSSKTASQKRWSRKSQLQSLRRRSRLLRRRQPRNQRPVRLARLLRRSPLQRRLLARAPRSRFDC
ncbi:MAG: hypothetical protein H6824_08360 [Planctomycetaceae bacterium]|nr:hypothetical protein [Planctomycetaceae bacterium]